MLRRILYTTLLVAPMSVSATPLVNMNEADQFDLKTDLIGITEKQAKDIVEYRKNNGKFSSENDLVKVEGVGRDDVNINRYYLHTGNDPRLQDRS